MNIYFKRYDSTLNQKFDEMVKNGQISTRGLKANANKSHNRIASPNAPTTKIGFIISPPIIYSLCKYATNLLTLTSEDLTYFPRSQFPFHVRYRAI